MRIKYKDTIAEMTLIGILENEITVNTGYSYETGDKTEEISKQLLEKGYADMTEFKYKLIEGE